MRSFLSPKWIFLLNTGPLLLLLLLGYGEFSVIKTLLPPASVNLWRLGALTLALLALAGTAYAGWCWRRGREVQLDYCLLTLLLYSAVLFAYTSQSNDFVPRSVPRWLVPTDFMLFVWTFLMPTLAHAGFTLVLLLTPDEENESAGVSFGLALLLPVLWAGIFSVLTALVPHSRPTLESWVLATGLVLATLSFFFFLIRAVYLLSLSRADAWGENILIWKVLIAAVLPVAGLLVNRGLAGGWRTESGVFGNFSSPWFYGLALLNAALLWWPVGRLGRGGRLALLAGRAALFGYTFYFFLVFLPWLPLALPAIVLLGTGFLLLAPLLLLVVHVRALSEDAAWLQAHFPRRLVTMTLLAGLLALPLCVTASYYHARLTLHEALEYVYAPDYAKTYDLNAASLARTVRTVRQHKSYASDFGFGAGQPYLSTYFNWLVLDNLMLSDAKLNELERVFLGVKPSPPPPAGRPNGFGRLPEAGAPAPALTAATARSTYDPRQQAWVSWLDLTIANRDTTRRAGEYRSSLRLPAGCYVSDYYLDINGRREPGLLAERKAAEWVYAQILHENDVRDPGLLSYHGPDELSLRVYPVVGATPRRTGLQLLHKEPVSVRIDGRELMLGDPAAAAPTATATAAVAAPTAAVVYLSAVAKKKLPLVRRRPRYHFLLDASVGATASAADYQARIARHFPQAAADPTTQYSLVNTYARPVPAGADWPAQFARRPRTGGYYLAGAIRRALAAAQLHPDPARYPVLVAVTDNLTTANLPANFADLAGACPESSVFYALEAPDQLTAHSLRRHSADPLPALPAASFPMPAVRTWPDAAHARAYLSDTDSAAIVLAQPDQLPPAPAAAAGKTWDTALLLHGYGQWQTLHPAAADARRLPFIQASFRTGILTPLTAYLALEDEAQKAALRRKQEQVLRANATLDVQEEEPDAPTGVPIDGGAGLLLTAGLLLAWWQLRRVR